MFYRVLSNDRMTGAIFSAMSTRSLLRTLPCAPMLEIPNIPFVWLSMIPICLRPDVKAKCLGAYTLTWKIAEASLATKDSSSAETAGRIIGGILHGEEREQHEQFHHLDEGEFAVRILNRTDHSRLYGEAIHHCCYALYCLAGIIVFEKTLEFTDYLSIFVHG